MANDFFGLDPLIVNRELEFTLLYFRFIASDSASEVSSWKLRTSFTNGEFREGGGKFRVRYRGIVAHRRIFVLSPNYDFRLVIVTTDREIFCTISITSE